MHIVYCSHLPCSVDRPAICDYNCPVVLGPVVLDIVGRVGPLILSAKRAVLGFFFRAKHLSSSGYLGTIYETKTAELPRQKAPPSAYMTTLVDPLAEEVEPY